MTRQVPIGNERLVCPFHRKSCDAVCHKCPLWVHVSGKNPNTGEELNEWRCSLAWLPTLLIENALHIRHAGAATESMRNEIVRRMDGVRQIGVAQRQQDEILPPPAVSGS